MLAGMASRSLSVLLAAALSAAQPLQASGAAVALARSVGVNPAASIPVVPAALVSGFQAPGSAASPLLPSAPPGTGLALPELSVRAVPAERAAAHAAAADAVLPGLGVFVEAKVALPTVLPHAAALPAPKAKGKAAEASGADAPAASVPGASLLGRLTRLLQREGPAESDGGALFDGSLPRAGAELGSLDTTSSHAGARQALLEARRRTAAHGIFHYPELTPPAAPYVREPGLRRLVRLSTALAWASAAGALAALYAGVGALPLACSFLSALVGTALGALLPPQGARRSAVGAYDDAFLQEYAALGVKVVLDAAGLDAEGFTVALDDSRGKDNASVRLQGAPSRGPRGTLQFGRAFLREASPRRVLAVIAHELGHVLLGHLAGTRVHGLGRFLLPGLLIGTTGLAMKLFHLWAIHAAWPGAFGLAAGGYALGLALWTAAGLFALRVVRGRELEADHFAAWLTDPVWLVEFFAERAAAESSGGSRTLLERLRAAFDALLCDHPSNRERIRRLQQSYGL